MVVGLIKHWIVILLAHLGERVCYGIGALMAKVLKHWPFEEGWQPFHWVYNVFMGWSFDIDQRFGLDEWTPCIPNEDDLEDDL